MCSLKMMNELNHVAVWLHSWAWSTAAAELRDGCGERKASPPVTQMSSVSPHVDVQTYVEHSLKAAQGVEKKVTFPKHPSIHFQRHSLEPIPAAFRPEAR